MFWSEGNLCQSRKIFEDISTDVWKKVSSSHSVGVDSPELGLTSDSVVSLLTKRKEGAFSVDVFTRKGKSENVRGSDMDIFIQVTRDHYVWIALQAKVLKKNQRYNTLRDGYSDSNPTFQWEKLSRLRKATGCAPFYLFYNGIEEYKYEGSDCYSRPFTEDQFGCSLVSLDIVEKYATKEADVVSNGNPVFSDFHPVHAQPWRILIEYAIQSNDLKTYRKEDLDEANRNFGLTNPNNVEHRWRVSDSPEYNPITLKSSISDWKPEKRLIINKI